MSSNIEVRYATPDDSESIATLYDEAYHGGYPIAECTEPDLVRQVLTERKHIWVLALDGGRVVATTVARLESARDCYEVCRGVVHPDYRGPANYGAAFDRSLRGALEREDCDFIYGWARSEHALSVFNASFDRAGLTWSPTGTDGGLHLVAGEREEHVFFLAINPERVVTRIAPPRSILIERSAVAREIAVLKQIALPGVYPARIASGGAAEFTYESDRGRVSLDVIERSRAAVVSAVEGDTPDDIRRLLWEAVDDVAPGRIEQLTVHALADKLPVIAALCRPGTDDPTRRFAVSDYLPGWHKEAGLRYDCVVLTAYTGDQLPMRFGLEDRIAAIYRSFPPAYRRSDPRTLSSAA